MLTVRDNPFASRRTAKEYQWGVSAQAQRFLGIETDACPSGAASRGPASRCALPDSSAGRRPSLGFSPACRYSLVFRQHASTADARFPKLIRSQYVPCACATNYYSTENPLRSNAGRPQRDKVRDRPVTCQPGDFAPAVGLALDRGVDAPVNLCHGGRYIDSNGCVSG